MRFLPRCPWKPATTWYGQAALTASVCGVTVAGWCYGPRAAMWCMNKAEAIMADRRRAEANHDNPLVPVPFLRRSQRPEYNDNSRYDAWHDSSHLPSALATGVVSLLGVPASAILLQAGRRLSETRCGQGLTLSLAVWVGISSAIGTIRALDHGWAWWCKRSADPMDRKAARLRHQSSILRQPQLKPFLQDHGSPDNFVWCQAEKPIFQKSQAKSKPPSPKGTSPTNE